MQAFVNPLTWAPGMVRARVLASRDPDSGRKQTGFHLKAACRRLAARHFIRLIVTAYKGEPLTHLLVRIRGRICESAHVMALAETALRARPRCAGPNDDL